MRRLRTLTVGLLTPFYFIRAGSLVSVPAVLAAPLVFLVLFGGKVVSKIFGLLSGHRPVPRRTRKERWYYTLMMSTGLTFGTISALYGLSHGIVSRGQYSFLVAVVIASAVVPTMIANAVFLPKHLLEAVVDEEDEIRESEDERKSRPKMAHDERKMRAQRPIDVPENHRRGIRATLMIFDELLCSVEEWAEGREEKSVLHVERNRLTPEQRSRLLQQAAGLRLVLDAARRELGLKPDVRDAASDIWCRCAAIREQLMEIEGRRLRRYGDVPSDLSEYMDALSNALLKGLDGLLADGKPSAPRGECQGP